MRSIEFAYEVNKVAHGLGEPAAAISNKAVINCYHLFCSWPATEYLIDEDPQWGNYLAPIL